MHFQHPPSKKLIIITAIIVIILSLILLKVFYLDPNKPLVYEFTTVNKVDLTQEVSVTGTIVPKDSADLSFEITGKVKGIYAAVGDSVTAGQVLIKLDTTELDAKLAQAQAAVDTSLADASKAETQIQSSQLGLKEQQAKIDSARALLAQYQAGLEKEQVKLVEIKKGARSEQLQVAQTKVINAQNNLIDAQTNLANVKNKATNDLVSLYDDVSDTIYASYTKADDAINKQITDLWNKSGTTYELSYSTSDLQAKSDVERQYSGIKDEVAAWKQEIDGLSATSTNENWDRALEKSRNHLVNVRDFLIRQMDTLNAGIDNASASKTTLNTYRTSVVTARTNINTELTAITTAQQGIASQKITNQNNISTASGAVNTAQNALDLAKNEQQLTAIQASPEEIAGQEAAVRQAAANVTSQKAILAQAQAGLDTQRSQIDQTRAGATSAQAGVKQAQANLQNAQAQLAKATITAPIPGIITKQDTKVGEIVSAQKNIISLLNPQEYKIETNIPEADTAKIKIGDTAAVTLDAYGDDVKFSAQVTKIDPAETVIEGVSTYKTTLKLNQKDERIKSGLTANVDILTAQRSQVLAIVQRAVINKDGNKFVQIIVIDPQTNRETMKEVPVKTGLRGSDGNIEITEGLAEGDKVIVYTKENP
ncbi:MAG: hypothetical protein A2445_02485 [Candidatus Jacksonbacteria bacterium RIFOXYC2_FULL_44_29]|nr:MAG: Efflux transporter, RND family, MFP subunit [Parcubacteria group bacterium GW2011_GWA2_42_28]OGY77395.1 MAG: hypothetical protein A2295_01695 [Candidatus Jacksonbacteria bacterium RIFOXYB2_FULL_44_15]OGY78167.1 MAG: hypothetical protein A2550_06040 [Candidatus Jacksonbacteria bacterium RIFOXYD2_FULL_43_21]OGY80743.1 MAG: hypothetical protein A2445_02485 [Candidatus Jacksonbacteria bacterium RIFOXYC2_FULL_44_29]HBH46680.1 hypothetical protein [Candidatus Jacksonbacteria bacterium]